jgi:hypothetical protein
VQAIVLLDDSMAVTPQYVLYLESPGFAVPMAQMIRSRFVLISISIFNFVSFLVGKAKKNGI